MREWFAQYGLSIVWLLCGLYAVLVGSGKLTNTKYSSEQKQWRRRHGRMMLLLGIVLMLASGYALLTALRSP